MFSRKGESAYVALAAVVSVSIIGAASRLGDAAEATLRIRASEKWPHRIPRYITGKFCEHLGFNIYHGMDAQILHNPTLAVYPFSAGDDESPDGGVQFYWQMDEIGRRIRRAAPGYGWPETAIEHLIEDYENGLACWWMLQGPREAVRVSPDNGKYGQRAQRVEVSAAGQGIAQWTYLPLHRVRQYEFELIARSPDLSSLTVSLTGPESETPCAEATVGGLSNNWKTLSGTLQMPVGLPDDAPYKFAVTANAAGQFVIERVLLRPADHIGGADPDVIRLLKESRLPILRWPGGNFVSNYHWEDGIGPPEQRPTRPNYAWGRDEPNLFGTDEFIAYCRVVGCDPMICVNAGSGTPDEAARWVGYCNGSVDTPMGALRAANGHPEPYNVHHWEIGNELWGRWQYHWTTPKGYVDRYRNFVKAMLAADPNITVYACGAPVIWNQGWDDWNRVLVEGAAAQLKRITVHPLIGGAVPADTDPMDVYRDFMAVPDVLEQRYAVLRQLMEDAGIEEPRLAITELQLFARIGRPSSPDAPRRLTRENLVTRRMIAEALYDVLIYHASVRLAPFVDMVTHSATINHGAGMRKIRERVYAEPAHYAQTMFTALAEAAPVEIELTAPTEHAPMVLPDLKRTVSDHTYKTVDALAAMATDGSLLISIIHRGTENPIRLAVTIDGFNASEHAELQTLAAELPWIGNTFDEQDRVTPKNSTAEVRDNRFTLDLLPYSFVLVRMPSE